MYADDIFAVVGLLIVAIIIILAGIFTVKTVKTENSCARLGFPDSNVTYTFDAYCIKRVNQTDSVVLLSKLQK